MPVKLREFYWNQLMKAKDTERSTIEKIKNSKGDSSGKRTTIRR
jgi:hypothetical protein